MSATSKFLDRLIPLTGASHADVVDYSIVIPMRYAECVAQLAGGHQVRFHNPRQLVGWSGPADQRSFLFRSGDRGIEIRIDTNQRRNTVRINDGQLTIVESAISSIDRIRRLIAPDGNLVFARITGREKKERASVSRARFPELAGFVNSA